MQPVSLRQVVSHPRNNFITLCRLVLATVFWLAANLKIALGVIMNEILFMDYTASNLVNVVGETAPKH